MTNANDDKIVKAQLDEANAAKKEAVHAKRSAQAERDSAQALKGEDRVKQPDDFSML